MSTGSQQVHEVTPTSLARIPGMDKPGGPLPAPASSGPPSLPPAALFGLSWVPRGPLAACVRLLLLDVVCSSLCC